MATDFLRDSAYKPGEFERLQRHFDTAVFELSAHLAEPIERAMRATMGGDIAALLAERVAAPAAFLDKPGPAGSAPAAGAANQAAWQAEVELLRTELSTLGSALELDEATVTEEVQACAGELAHHTLALWLTTLRRALVPDAGAALNANMLPGEMSMQQVLDELDVDAFGVQIETVILALSGYRATLRARAVQGNTMIEFADDLLIAVGRDDALRPYTLYASREAYARDLARARAVPQKPPVNQVRMQLLKLAQRIDMAISDHTAPVERYERLIDAALQNPEVSRFKVGNMRVTLPSAMAAAARNPVPPVQDDLLAYPIEAGADLLGAHGFAGATLAGASLAEQLNAHLPGLAEQLNDYSEMRSIPFETVSTAYSVFVAARCQPMTVDVQVWNQANTGVAVVQIEEQFAQALDLSVDASTTLINDATAGLGVQMPFIGR